MFSMNISLLRESPSVLFCASDGRHLRIYQVVCNAKTLLATQFSTSKVGEELLNKETSLLFDCSSRIRR